MRYQHNWFCTCLQYRPAAVVCSYDRYVQNWISLAYQKQFSCENFSEMIMYLSKLNGDKSLLCLHMFRRACSTYCEVSTQVQSTMNPQRHLLQAKPLYYFTLLAIALDSWIFQSILITTGENFETACLWAMTDRKVIMRPKTNIQSKIYESFLFRAGGKKYWWSQDT